MNMCHVAFVRNIAETHWCIHPSQQLPSKLQIDTYSYISSRFIFACRAQFSPVHEQQSCMPRFAFGENLSSSAYLSISLSQTQQNATTPVSDHDAQVASIPNYTIIGQGVHNEQLMHNALVRL